MRRPALNEIPLDSFSIGKPVPGEKGQLFMTIDVGAWDAMIAAAYDIGFILIEMDQRERPIRAFRKVEGEITE